MLSLPRGGRASRRRPSQRRQTQRRTRRSTRPATCLGMRSRARRRSIRDVTRADLDAVRRRERHRENTVRPRRLGGSTPDTARSTPSTGAVRRSRSSSASGLHDRRLPRRVSSLPWGEALGYDIPPLRLPAAGRDLDLGRHPQVRLQLPRARRCSRSATAGCATQLYFMRQDWSGGKYLSPGIAGSRSGGLLAATWASMVYLGREGYLTLREGDLRDRVTRCRTWSRSLKRRSASSASRACCFSFTSDDVRHLPCNRLHAGARLALQRTAVPERAPTCA